MELKNMYINELLESYPYAGDFFETFGLNLKAKHVRLQQYMEGLKKDIFDEIGIEKTQLMEHFQYFIMSTERFINSKQRVA